MTMLLILAASLLLNAALWGGSGVSSRPSRGPVQTAPDSSGLQVGALALLLVPTLAAAILLHHALGRWLPPWEQPYVRAPLAILLVAACLGAIGPLESFLQRRWRVVTGPARLWLTSNCVILGLASSQLPASAHLAAELLTVLPLCAAFIALTFIGAALHGRLIGAHVPSRFEGLPIAMITAGLAVLAFYGMAGFPGLPAAASAASVGVANAPAGPR